MNIKQIQSIEIWSPNGLSSVDKLKFLSFYGYDFNGSGGYVDYQLLGPNDEMQYQATIPIPESVVQQWGADDGIIWSYVVSALGLVIV